MLVQIRCVKSKPCNHRVIGRVPSGLRIENRKANVNSDLEFEYQCPRCKEYYTAVKTK